MIQAKRVLLILFMIGFVGMQAAPEVIPFDSERWEMQAAEKRIEAYQGQKSLYMKGGLALIKDSDFTNGIIEFDVAFGKERGFAGVRWRYQGGGNYEDFYLRPHQSGNPDANQYTPVFNGVSGWQLYHGQGYAKPVVYDFNQWMHVKIVVSGSQAEVYIKDMETPAVIIHELKHDIKSGKLGVGVGNFAPAYFSNFSYTAMSSPPALKGTPMQMEPPAPGTIMKWQVSNAINEASLQNKHHLTAAEKSALTWQPLESEHTGLANLARVQGISQESNTAFAKVTVFSDFDQIKRVKLGYSDRVLVYCNDRLIYGGNNTYRTRDYRYLGTIGYFDEVYLDLKKGENELWIAVSESFGGWGLQAVFEDQNGIEVR